MNVRIQIQVIPLNVRSIKSLRIIVEDVYDLQKTVKDFINEFPTGCHCPKANCQFHGDIYIRCQMSCYFSLFNVLLTMKLPESKNQTKRRPQKRRIFFVWISKSEIVLDYSSSS